MRLERSVVIIDYSIAKQTHTLLGAFPTVGFSKHPTMAPHSFSAISPHLWSMCLAMPHGVSQMKRRGGYFKLRYRSAASLTDS